MRFFFSSGVRNDLLQEIADNTDTVEVKLQSLIDKESYPFGLSNKIPIGATYDAVLAPHASTSRLSYTVPVGKQAVLTSTAIHLGRVTAPSAVGSSRAWINITPSGGGGVIVQSVTKSLPNVDSDVESPLIFNYALNAGDVVEFRSSDSSTGGTVMFIINAAVVEFDV